MKGKPSEGLVPGTSSLTRPIWSTPTGLRLFFSAKVVEFLFPPPLLLPGSKGSARTPQDVRQVSGLPESGLHRLRRLALVQPANCRKCFVGL